MSSFTGFAIYFIIWWLTLFIVIPHGNKSQLEEGDVALGTDPGAPKKPRLLWKLFLNSVLALVIFVGYWFVTTKLGLGLHSIPNFFPHQ